MSNLQKRKIVAITGARSEYDLLYSVFDKLNKDESIDFGIIITGPHLSEKYGLTSQFIEKDKFKIFDKIYNLIDSDSKLARISSIGVQIPLLAQSLNRIQPDIVLVAGDREESISTAMTCAYMDIICAHFFGGDIAKDGNIDNSVRYATSKFAHIHFPTLVEHKETLLKLGEDEFRINVVGNPALDKFLSTEKISSDEIYKFFKLDPKENYAVLIQHSIITEINEQPIHIRETLDALVEKNIFTFINYPNSDAGSSSIIEAYEEYSIKYPNNFYLFKNLERTIYINLLRNAHFLIGNSSSGLLEAPSLGLAAINVGTRQRDRIHGKNMIFVSNSKKEILQAITKIETDTEFRKELNLKINPYGNGKSGQKVVEILKSIKLDSRLLYKNITY
jgi:GDP/UDP-N,N'-diacetylbacillosamine 2-epimerase (hydrolysing)